MRNAWRVFTRDAGRLARVSKAWIIIVGVIITPSLYAWFNIVAFWDPYSNTEHINVAIVNLDEGAHSDVTGDIDVGGELVDQLRQNHELGWQFLDEDEALESVRTGGSYAAIVIPRDFSRDFVSITTGEFTRPTLKYYVNEKANAIAPKITDVGASTLDTQVNSTFVSVVAEAAAEELRGAGESTEDRLLDAQGNAVTALDEAVTTMSSARERITGLKDGLAGAQDRLRSAQGTLRGVDGTLADVQSAVSQAQTIAAEAQQELITFTDSVTGAYVSGATMLADASSKLNTSITKVSTAVQQANLAVGTAIDDVSSVITSNGETLTDLQALLDSAEPGSDAAQRLSDAITALQERNAADQQVLAQLQQLNTDVAGTTDALQQSADAIDTAVQDAATSASSIRNALLGTIPDLNRAMSTLSSSAGAFSSALGAQRTQVTQAGSLLQGLSDQLDTASAALDALDGNLAAAQQGLDGVRTDVLALSTADIWNRLGTLTGLDPEQIAQFMASPVEVHENVVFPVDSYGSAMAALFTNLSLWIGAFVLMVIFKLEVDADGIPGLTVRQAYFGRWMLLAAIAFFQAVLVCVGNLIIGVQTVNAFAFVGTGVLIGLAYLSIIYALSVSFGYVGKAMCILLVIMQIPSASGLYPIEMMPGFFRALYPFLPFTYGIDAMRETISGFYDGHWWRFMGVLAIFVALSFLLGLFLRRRLGNFTRLFNRRIAATQLLVSEDVQLTAGRHQLPHIIHALEDGEGYRGEIARRARRFTHRYPTLLRLTLLIGLGVMAVLALAAWLIPGGKAWMLGLWVLWCLLIIGFLVALEYVKQSIQLATEVGQMPESELRLALLNEGAGGAARVSTEEPTSDAGDQSSDAGEDTLVLEEMFSDAAGEDAEDESPEDESPEDESPEDESPEDESPEDESPEDESDETDETDESDESDRGERE